MTQKREEIVDADPVAADIAGRAYLAPLRQHGEGIGDAHRAVAAAAVPRAGRRDEVQGLAVGEIRRADESQAAGRAVRLLGRASPV